MCAIIMITQLIAPLHLMRPASTVALRSSQSLGWERREKRKRERKNWPLWNPVVCFRLCQSLDPTHEDQDFLPAFQSSLPSTTGMHQPLW